MKSTNKIRRWDYLLGLALAMVLLISCRATVMADTVVPIYAGSTISASNTDKSGFSVTYEYRAASAGYFQYSFASRGTDDWSIEVKKDNFSEIYSDRCNDTDSVESAKFPVCSGQVYYITLTKVYHSSGGEYSLTINHTTSDVWEKEDNDSQSKANNIQGNIDYYGTLYSDDQDWYKFVMPANGYVTFSLSQEEMFTSSHPDYRLTVLDSKGNKLDDRYGYDINSTRLAYKKGTVFYAYVENYSSAKFRPYKFRVNYKKTDFYEKESNDSASTATSIQVGKTYTGVINYYNDDIDYYKFVLKTPMKFKLDFGPEDLSRSGTWRVKLKDSKNNTVELLRGETKQSKSGYLKKGTYYIVVENYNNTRNIPYTLKLSTSTYAFTKPTLSSCKITANSSWSGIQAVVKLKKKSKTAEGYQVMVSSSKKMSNADTCMEIQGNKTSQTVKDTRHYYDKGNYKYVAVRAFVKDPFGNYTTSSMSNVLKVKIPKIK